MKHFIYNPLILVLSAGSLCLQSCAKSKQKDAASETTTTTSVLLQADTEVRSSLSVLYASYVASDFAMMMGFLAEEKLDSTFFHPAPASSVSSNNSTVTITVDKQTRMFAFAFNNTKCIDGRIRAGTVFGDYATDPATFPSPQNVSEHFRDYSFGCKVNLVDYVIDEWKVTNIVGKPLLISNTLSDPAFKPSETNITWRIKGGLRFVNTKDTALNIIWNGQLDMALINTSNVNVFASDKQSAIKWKLGIAAYNGSASGVIGGQTTYTLSILSTNPLKRDFTCALPIPYLPSSLRSEFHPFIDGNAMLTVSSSQKARTISLGSLTGVGAACNNEGYIYVDGTTIPFSLK